MGESVCRMKRRLLPRLGPMCVFTVLMCIPGASAEGQRVVPLDPEDPEKGRLILSRGLSDAHESCPTSAYQFSFDSEQDPEWTAQNRELWQEDVIIQTVRQAMARAWAALPGPSFDLCLGIASRPTQPWKRWEELGEQHTSQQLSCSWLPRP